MRKSQIQFIKLDNRIHLKYGLKGIEPYIYWYACQGFMFWDFNSVKLDFPWFKLKTPDSLYRILLRLEKKGLLKRVIFTYREAFEKLKQGEFSIGCEFCGENQLYLDSHHYPIKKSDGGVMTIDICPNCHRKFHLLADLGTWKLSTNYYKNEPLV